MTHPTRTVLDAAIADSRRGHRPHEWEDVAYRLARAAGAYAAHVDEKRAQDETPTPRMITRLDIAGMLDIDPEAMAKLTPGKIFAVPGDAKSLKEMQAEVIAWAQRKGKMAHNQEASVPSRGEGTVSEIPTEEGQ